MFVTGLLLLTTGIQWKRGSQIEVERIATPLRPLVALIEYSPDSLDEAAAAAIAHDPFRLAGRPASRTFLLQPTAIPVSGASIIVRPVRPSLVVRAIIGGPPWNAIIDGLPDQAPNTVVAPGASFAALQVVAISRDSVIIQGSDTTWRLGIHGGDE